MILRVAMLAAVCVALLGPMQALAASVTLSSGLVSPTVEAAYNGLTGTVTVVEGVDLVNGAGSFDIDHGPEGDLFIWTAPGPIIFDAPQVLTFTGLEFADGEVLVGFLPLINNVPGLSWTFTETSLTLMWGPTSISPVSGKVVSFRYLTAPAVIPLPAGGVLLLTGLAALGVSRRRRVA